ncbi:MAG TPA: sigma-54 dependent transcriptional regulator [Humisphaera sp.]|jgi:NtrC-family two-component system response regulator AlgB|nr:sigma-54 dependent transcriptional regulator [Humisphaera sp.]
MSSKKQVRALIVDDEADISRMIAMCLQADGHESMSVSTIGDAVTQAAHRSFDLILLDLRLGTENGLDAIGPLLATSPWVRIVVITAFSAVETAVEAMKRGASEYLAKPFTPAQIRLVVKKVAEAQALARRAAALQELVAGTGPSIDLDTKSAAMRDAIEVSHRAADGTAAILIRGEPGTGKRTLARAIHAWSPRAEQPFTVAGSRAPTAAHLEAEWFGTAKKMPGGNLLEQGGRIAYCDGGTLLIEDVDRLPLTTQPKLLRLIQDHEYERPGDFSPHRSDVRIIATTAADLDALAGKGELYPDLLYALRGVSIELPPLRRRPDDIPILADRYLAFFARQTRRPVVGFSEAAIDELCRHSWPGNIRELRNMVERAVLVCRGEKIEPSDFPLGGLNRVNAVALGDPVPLDMIEELHIRGVLASTPSLDSAAATLGLDTTTLWRRRKKYGI